MKYLPFLLCLSAFGQTTLYVPTGTTYCIKSATNATPIVITTAGCDLATLASATPAAVAHGWANDTVVVIAGVEGNTAANGTRVVKNVTSTTAELYAVGNTPVVGNGAFVREIGSYTSYPQVAAGTLTTLKDHPRVWLDGPSGALTSTLCTGSAPCRAVAGNPAWTKMKTAVDAYVLPENPAAPAPSGLQFKMTDNDFGPLVSAALIYQSTGNTTYRDWVITALKNIDRYANGFGCLTSVMGCGDKTVLDFMSKYSWNIAQAYSIVRGGMTSGERATFANKFLNDDKDGACTQRFYPGTGTVNQPAYGSITGNGTLWLTNPDPAQRLAVGDTIIYSAGCTQGACNAVTKFVTAVTSDTAISYYNGQAGGAFDNPPGVTNGAFWIGKPWVEGNCGVMSFVNRSAYSIMASGKMYPSQIASGVPGEWGGAHIYSKTQDTSWREPLYNQNPTKALGFLALGLALADDDVRAIPLIQRVVFWWKDFWHPLNTSWTAGGMQDTSKYVATRLHPFSLSLAIQMRNSTVESHMDYTSSNWLRSILSFWVYGYNPAGNGFTRLFLGRPVHNRADQWKAPMSAAYITGDSAEARAWWSIVRASMADTTDLYHSISQGPLLGYPENFLFYDSYATATAPDGAIPSAKNLAVTDSQPNGEGTGLVISRTGWQKASTILEMHAAGVYQGTHVWPLTFSGNPASYKILKRYYLLAEDQGNGIQPTFNAYGAPNEQSNFMHIGPFGATSASLLQKTKTTDDRQFVKTPRFWRESSDAAAYAMIDYAGAYQAAAQISFAHRHFAHFKAAGKSEYVIVADAVRTTGGQAKVTFLHYPNNNQPFTTDDAATTAMSPASPMEGGTTFSTDSVVSDSPASRILTKIMKPGGAATLRIYTDAPNGTYTGSTDPAKGPLGGAGQTFRVSICASADGSTCDPSNLKANMLVAHRIVDGTTETSNPAALLSTIDTNFIGVQVDDTDNSIVAVFPAEGGTLSSASFTSTHGGTGRYLVSGLTAGTWSITRGVTTVNGAATVDSSGVLYWESTAGAYTLARTGAGALSIATASLPTAVRGSAYSYSLAATGGALPYAWDITSGSLPAGLTLSGAGLISGTVTATTGTSVTVRVTDGAAATASATFTLSVSSPALSITTASLSGAAVGVAYTASLAASGGVTPYAWSIATGSLPAGLTLSSGGTISGTPLAAGAANFTVRVTDSLSATSTQALSITATAGVIAITTAALPPGKVASNYSQVIATSGGSGTQTWDLPANGCPWLSVSSAGVVSGTPASPDACLVTVRVTDTTGSSSRDYTISVADLITVTVVPTGAAGSAIIRYTSAGVPWNQVCTATLTKDGSVAWTQPDSGGRMPRVLAAAGLDAGTYGIALDCSVAEIGTGTVTVTAAGGGTSSLKVGGSANTFRGAVKMRAEWGYTSDVTGTPVTVACTGVGIQQCMATITGINAGSVVFVRLSYLDSSDAVVATGEAVPVTVQ